MHLRIARAELALAETQTPNTERLVLPALDLATAVAETYRSSPWSRWARIAIHALRIFLKGTAAPTAEVSPAPPTPAPELRHVPPHLHLGSSRRKWKRLRRAKRTLTHHA